MLVRLSTRETRGLLFSLNYGLATLAGMLGSAIGGQLPLLLNRMFNIMPETAASYQGVLLFSAAFNLLGFVPLMLMKIPEGVTNGDMPTETVPVENKAPNGKKFSRLQSILHNPVSYQLTLPNLGFGIGAALFIPYLNLFFVNKFNVSDQLLGTLFSLGSLTTGIGMLLSSYFAHRVGSRIRAILRVQNTSIIFMMILGYSPWLNLAMFGYLVRGALMNMGAPLYDSFAMDQVSEQEQGTFNSLLMMSFQTGWAIGPFLSSLLQEHIGFQPIFLISGTIYSLSMFIFWYFFRNKEDFHETQTASSLT
jgi:MFS family permease